MRRVTAIQHGRPLYGAGLIEGWRARGWRTADKKPVKNQDLWERLDAANRRHQVEWRWLKGHAGHELNERADELARAAIKALRDGIA